VMKGQLFYPTMPGDRILDCLAPGHLQGIWMPWDEFRLCSNHMLMNPWRRA
jgi:hypothetical protein